MAKKEEEVRSSEPNTLNPPPEGINEPGPKYTTKCIYFPDKAKLYRLERLLSKYPRATLSTLIAQLLEPMIKAIEKIPEGTRHVQFQCKVWI
jgi:hypothetical protein